MGTLSGHRILLCVCGGIAAYKAAELVRRLRQQDAEVRVAMTADALRFVGAPTFQALSGQPVRSSLWDEAAEAAMGHIELARWPGRILVAPATANMLAKLAHGLADDLVSTLCLATEAPIAVAPALIIQSMLVTKIASAEHSTEAFTWTTSALLAGVGIGLGVGGLMLEHLPSSAALAAGAAASLGAAAAARLLLGR